MFFLVMEIDQASLILRYSCDVHGFDLLSSLVDDHVLVAEIDEREAIQS
jgi:hypothetical protein